MSTPDAGWYPDETEPYLMRWFDGEAWTEDTAPLPAAAPEPEPAAVPSSMPAFVASGLPALVPVPAGGAVWYPDGTVPVEPETPRHADAELPELTAAPVAHEAHRHTAAPVADDGSVPQQSVAAHDATAVPPAVPPAVPTAVPTALPAAPPTAVPTGRRAARLAAAAVATTPERTVGPPPPPPEPTTGLTAVPTGRRAARLAAEAHEIAAAPGALLIPTLEPWEEPPALPVALVTARPAPEPDVAPAVPWAAETSEPVAWAAPAPVPAAPSASVPVSPHPYAPPTVPARAPEGGWAGPQAYPGGYPAADAPARPGNDPHDALHWIVPLGRSWQSIVAGYLGLVGLVLWPLAPVAAGLGAWAMVKARSGGHGRGRAVFAIVTGVAGTAFGVIALLSLGAVV